MAADETIVSNYPRGADGGVLTPAIAKSVLQVAALNQGWAILPQLAWFAFLFFSISRIYSAQWSSYGTQVCIILGVIAGSGGLVAQHIYVKKMYFGTIRIVASYFLWLWGYLPLIGPLGPILLQHLLCKDMKRFGITSRFNVLNQETLRSNVDERSLEALN